MFVIGHRYFNGIVFSLIVWTFTKGRRAENITKCQSVFSVAI